MVLKGGISGVAGDDHDDKVAAEADKNKNVPLEKCKSVKTLLLVKYPGQQDEDIVSVMQHKETLFDTHFWRPDSASSPPLKSGIKRVIQTHNKAFHSVGQNIVQEVLIAPCR